MKTVLTAVLLASAALVALAPGVTANHAGTPQAWPTATVCLYETINPDYYECYGYTYECENGQGFGVGHTYDYNGAGTPPHGQSGGWCYAYVVLDTGQPRADVCHDDEAGLDLCVGASSLGPLEDLQ